jgi:hypothetical protein
MQNGIDPPAPDGRTSPDKETTMKGRTWILTLALVAGVALPSAAEAQDREGIGAIIDWINKLSGPTMVGPGISWYTMLGDDVRLRVSGSYLTSVASDDVIDPDDAGVNAFSIKPAVEFPIGRRFSVGGGFSLHNFGGDADERFWHWSVPVYGQVRLKLAGTEARPTWLMRFGLGAEYFSEFGPDDFAPITTGVSTDGGEVTLVGFLGFEYVLKWNQ